MKNSIGLIDVDGHNFPNLPLMKISAYHKSKGDSVEWVNPLFGEYDVLYKSNSQHTPKPREQTILDFIKNKEVM